MKLGGALNTYEGVFILDEFLKGDALEETLADIRREVESLDGKVESVTRLGRRAFARPQQKKSAGMFFVLTFDLQPDKVAKLNDRMKMKSGVFRVQIVRAAPGETTLDTASHAAGAGSPEE